MVVCIRVTDEITRFKKSSTNAFLVFLQVSDCIWIHVDDSKFIVWIIISYAVTRLLIAILIQWRSKFELELCL